MTYSLQLSEWNPQGVAILEDPRDVIGELRTAAETSCCSMAAAADTGLQFVLLRLNSLVTERENIHNINLRNIKLYTGGWGGGVDTNKQRCQRDIRA